MSGLVEASKSGAALAHGVSLREALRVWTRVALLSFGEPAGQIAVMHRIIVDEKHWVSEERFLHALNYCMLLPGPGATQLATYIGWLMHRTLGGVMAGVLFVTPGIIALMGLSYVYAAYGNVPVITALFFGLKAAVLAIVLEALSRISKRALKNRLMFALAALAFIAIFFLGVPFPIIIIAAALIGFVAQWLNLAEFHNAAAHAPAGAGKAEAVSSLLGEEPPAHAQPSLGRVLPVAATWLALWLAPVIALFAARESADVFTQIGVFFSKMAVVTFGRAYAVLAYVAQQAVEIHGWLKPGKMLDGLGMAETTPGPLIMGALAATAARRHIRRIAGDLGNVHAVLSLDLCRRAVHRKSARQQGTERRVFRDHGSGGRRHSQPCNLVRRSQHLSRHDASSRISVLVRCAGIGECRSMGACAGGRGSNCDLPVQSRHDRDARGMLRCRHRPSSHRGDMTEQLLRCRTERAAN